MRDGSWYTNPQESDAFCGRDTECLRTMLLLAPFNVSTAGDSNVQPRGKKNTKLYCLSSTSSIILLIPCSLQLTSNVAKVMQDYLVLH